MAHYVHTGGSPHRELFTNLRNRAPCLDTCIHLDFLFQGNPGSEHAGGGDANIPCA